MKIINAILLNGIWGRGKLPFWVTHSHMALATLGQITHNKVEKELGIQNLNNLYSSNYSLGELLGVLLKRTLPHGPGSQSTF